MHTTIPLTQRLMSLAREMILLGRTLAAAETLDRLLAMDDLDPDIRLEALSSLAVIHREAGRFPEARRVLATARKQFPDDADILLRTALVCIDDPGCGLDRTYRALRRAAARLPQNPRLRLHLGIVCSKLGDRAAARHHLRSAIARIHREPAILEELAFALLEIGSVSTATRLVDSMRFRLTPHAWQRLDRNFRFRLTAIRQQRSHRSEGAPSTLAFEPGEGRAQTTAEGGILRFDRAAVLRPRLLRLHSARRNRNVP